MSETREIELTLPQVADTPFNDLEGDVVLRTTDGVHFYVHKFLLSLVSPVFKDLFLLPESKDVSQELFQNKPCISVDDDSCSLFQVLSWCDPRVLSISQKGEHLQSALRLADKYDMKCITQRLEKSLGECMELINASPIEMYILAIQYGFKDLAKKAAKASLSVPLAQRPKIPALREISATALHNLYQYHLACSEAVRSYMDRELWLNVGGRHEFKEDAYGYYGFADCCARHPVHRQWLAYLPNYMYEMKWELFSMPIGATIQNPKFQGTLQQSMRNCSSCKDKSAAMTEFLKAVGIGIDSVVAQVSYHAFNLSIFLEYIC